MSRLDRVIFDPDAIPPSIPVGLTATPVGLTRLDIAWNASTDTGGSGLAGYQLEIDSVTIVPLGIQTSYSHTGLVAGSSHLYRVRAFDAALNFSAFSSPITGNTPNQAPAWSGTPSPSFSQGTGSSYSFAALVADPEGDPITITLASGTLPSGVTINSSAKTLVYNGSGAATTATGLALRATATGGATNSATFSLSITGSSSVTALQDWNNRSTAAGVVQAKRFAVTTDVTAWTHNDGTQGFCSLDTTDGIMGNGCLKITIPATQDNATGQWRVPLNASWVTDGQGFGATEFWVQYRIKLGPNRLLHSNGGGGFKVANTAGFIPSSPGSSQSHTGHEIVIGNGFNQQGILYAYREHPVSGTTPFETSDGNGDIHLQTAVDNGSGIVDKFARYCLYQSGNASSGCWRYTEQQWITIDYRIKIPSYGGNGVGNEIDIWATRDGETTRTLLYNNRNFVIGSDSSYPLGVNGIWFLNYDTNRTSGAADTWFKYDQLIVSTQSIAIPQAPAVVAGSAPAWFTAAANKQWVTPLSNTLAAVIDPLANTTNKATTGHHSIVDTYNGLMVDAITGDVALLGNGGHNDYAGNEVYHVNLKTQTAWVRRRNASASEGGGLGEFRNWSDGRPTANHTYDYQVGANGRWFSMGRAAANYTGGGAGKRAVYEFTHGTAGTSNNNDWIDYGNIRQPGGGTGDIWACYDPTNNWLVCVAGHDAVPGVQAFRVSDMASIASNNSSLNDSNVFVGALDTTNRVILLHNSSGWFWFPLAQISSGGIWHTISPSSNTLGIEHGFAWHVPSQAFVTYKNGTGLIKLVPTFSGGGYTALTGWTTVSGVTGTAPPSPIIDIHGRIKLINDMGDGRSALVTLPVYGSPDLYVMPLPAAGI